MTGSFCVKGESRHWNKLQDVRQHHCLIFAQDVTPRMYTNTSSIINVRNLEVLIRRMILHHSFDGHAKCSELSWQEPSPTQHCGKENETAYCENELACTFGVGSRRFISLNPLLLDQVPTFTYPHWSNELRPQMNPWTAVRCSYRDRRTPTLYGSQVGKRKLDINKNVIWA